MRIRQLIFVAGLASLQIMLLPCSIAVADGREHGGPLPLLGATALAQYVVAGVGGLLLWRRKR